MPVGPWACLPAGWLAQWLQRLVRPLLLRLFLLSKAQLGQQGEGKGLGAWPRAEWPRPRPESSQKKASLSRSAALAPLSLLSATHQERLQGRRHQEASGDQLQYVERRRRRLGPSSRPSTGPRARRGRQPPAAHGAAVVGAPVAVTAAAPVPVAHARLAPRLRQQRRVERTGIAHTVSEGARTCVVLSLADLSLRVVIVNHPQRFPCPVRAP